MKIYNSYILIIAILLLLTTVILVALEQKRLDIYFTIYILEALIVTELYVYFNAKARQGLSLVTSILMVSFLGIVALQVVKILA